MLTTLAALLLASSSTQPSPLHPYPDDDCSDLRHLELSLPVLYPPRICVSPGSMTGVLFDRPVDVEVQEEVRFVEVIRGRKVIGFIPPRDMLPEEPLRLTAVLGIGEERQRLTFVLVAHPGQGSHQVEVSLTERSFQSMSDALDQALLANSSLSKENAALKEETTRMSAQLTQPRGLSGAYAEGQLDHEGISTHFLSKVRQPDGALGTGSIVSYRGHSNIAVEVMLTNRTQEPWSLEEATLVNEKGETLKALRFQQAEALMPNGELPVFVEFDPKGFTLDRATLILTGSGKRGLTLSNVVFPEWNILAPVE